MDAVRVARESADTLLRAKRQGASASEQRALLAKVGASLVALKETDRKLAAELARADDGSQAGRRALDARASELQELQLERAVCAREIEACETGPALTTLDEDALAPLPADPSAAGGAAATPVDQKQVRLRRLAAELRRRRELQERIGALTAEVGVTRAKRQRLLDARERVHPELDAVLSASAPLRLYLSLSAHVAVSEGGGGGAADARAADLLEPPLHTLHARACVLLGSAQLGSTLVGARIVPCADALAHAAHAWPAVLRPSERCVCLELLCSRAQLSLVFSYHPAVHLLAVTAVQGKGGVRAAELLGAIDHDDDGQTFPHCRALLAASRGGGAPVRAHHLRPAVAYRWVQWLGGIEPDDDCCPDGNADGARRPLAAILEQLGRGA